MRTALAEAVMGVRQFEARTNDLLARKELAAVMLSAVGELLELNVLLNGDPAAVVPDTRFSEDEFLLLNYGLALLTGERFRQENPGAEKFVRHAQAVKVKLERIQATT